MEKDREMLSAVPFPLSVPLRGNELAKNGPRKGHFFEMELEQKMENKIWKRKRNWNSQLLLAVPFSFPL